MWMFRDIHKAQSFWDMGYIYITKRQN